MWGLFILTRSAFRGGKNSTVSVYSDLSEVSYILNLRGSDIECCPVCKSYCVVTSDSCNLYCEDYKIKDVEEVRLFEERHNDARTRNGFDYVPSFRRRRRSYCLHSDATTAATQF